VIQKSAEKIALLVRIALFAAKKPKKKRCNKNESFA
jgi:hypothetical protein